MSGYITSRVLSALAIICFALAAADFFRERHGAFAIEQTPLFYCLFGFAVYIAVIFIARGLRRLTLRPEDYYGAEATDQEDERVAGTEEARNA
ncbi:MAG: hypothetical protein WBG82_16075 [Parvibaculum sp.]|uniref:hypothetical protein n=1 Tax=Parvibaculum sp. TaxID=2024848 RepID=UPI003C731788